MHCLVNEQHLNINNGNQNKADHELKSNTTKAAANASWVYKKCLQIFTAQKN